MGKVQRQEQMLYEQLKTSGKMTLLEAMTSLGASESTVRRLFIGLEKSKCALRIHGGIQLIENQLLEYSFEALEKHFVEQKKFIAARAVEFVADNDVVYVDSGTTLAHFSTLLSQRLVNEELKNVVIITNSLINLTLFQNHKNLLFVGGEFRVNRKDFCGYMAEETLKTLTFAKCFLGTDGFNVDSGFTTTDFQTARLNEIVLKNTAESNILMDSSKFNTSAIISYTKNRKIDRVFTDNLPGQPALDALEQKGTEIVICDPLKAPVLNNNN